MCTSVLLSCFITFLVLRQIDDLKWGKYLDLFDLESTIPVREALGWKRLYDYCWCVGPLASPSPTIELYGISLADSRDCHLGLFIYTKILCFCFCFFFT